MNNLGGRNSPVSPSSPSSPSLFKKQGTSAISPPSKFLRELSDSSFQKEISKANLHKITWIPINPLKLTTDLALIEKFKHFQNQSCVNIVLLIFNLLLTGLYLPYYFYTISTNRFYFSSTVYSSITIIEIILLILSVCICWWLFIMHINHQHHFHLNQHQSHLDQQKSQEYLFLTSFFTQSFAFKREVLNFLFLNLITIFFIINFLLFIFQFPANFQTSLSNSHHDYPIDNLLLLILVPHTIIAIYRIVHVRTLNIQWILTISTLLTAAIYLPTQRSIFILILYFITSILSNIDKRLFDWKIFQNYHELEEIIAYNNKKAAEKKAQEMRDMIANVAHDLKTPLTSFMSATEMISMELNSFMELPNLTFTQKNLFQDVYMNINSSISIIHDIHSFMLMVINRCVDYTKASRGIALTANIETINFQDVVMGPVKTMMNIQQKIPIEVILPIDQLPSNLISSKPAALLLGAGNSNNNHNDHNENNMDSLNPPIFPFIKTDKVWLTENLLCILSNAVKFSQDGGVTFKISILNKKTMKNFKYQPSKIIDEVIVKGLTSQSSLLGSMSSNPDSTKDGNLNNNNKNGKKYKAGDTFRRITSSLPSARRFSTGSAISAQPSSTAFAKTNRVHVLNTNEENEEEEEPTNRLSNKDLTKKKDAQLPPPSSTSSAAVSSPSPGKPRESNKRLFSFGERRNSSVEVNNTNSVDNNPPLERRRSTLFSLFVRSSEKKIPRTSTNDPAITTSSAAAAVADVENQLNHAEKAVSPSSPGDNKEGEPSSSAVNNIYATLMNEQQGDDPNSPNNANQNNNNTNEFGGLSDYEKQKREKIFSMHSQEQYRRRSSLISMLTGKNKVTESLNGLSSPSNDLTTPGKGNNNNNKHPDDTNDVSKSHSNNNKQQQPEKEYLLFEITDNGPGLSPYELVTFFNPFKQRRLSGGTGLGLYALAKRVQVLGGKFGVLSRTDGHTGTIVWFMIPYIPDKTHNVVVAPTASSLTGPKPFQSLSRVASPSISPINSGRPTPIVPTKPIPVNIAAAAAAVTVVHPPPLAHDKEKTSVKIFTKSEDETHRTKELNQMTPRAQQQQQQQPGISPSSNDQEEFHPEDLLLLQSASPSVTPRHAITPATSLTNMTTNTKPFQSVEQQQQQPPRIQPPQETNSSTTIMNAMTPVPPQSSSTATSTKQKLTILVVEDAPTIAKMTSRLLQRQGHETEIAENGKIALDKILSSYKEYQYEKTKYDFILMDFQMPVMDGLDATFNIRQFERLKSISKECQQLIVGISAMSDTEMIEQARVKGINDFIPKPFSIQNVLQYYSNLKNNQLQQQQQQQQLQLQISGKELPPPSSSSLEPSCSSLSPPMSLSTMI